MSKAGSLEAKKEVARRFVVAILVANPEEIEVRATIPTSSAIVATSCCVTA